MLREFVELGNLTYTGDVNKHDDVSKMKDKYGDLGTLKVLLWREVELSRNHNPDNTFAFDDLGAVPEKALKGRPLDVATKYTRTNFIHGKLADLAQVHSEDWPPAAHDRHYTQAGPSPSRNVYLQIQDQKYVIQCD